MPTALITSTGSVATDIVLKTLRRLGYRTVGCNIYPKEWVVESCDVDVFHKIPRISDSQEYLEAIKRICLDDGVNYVLPMIDYEIDIFNQNREWFKNHGIILCMSPKNTLDIVRNKKALADFVRDNCPETQYIPTEFLCDLKTLPWQFPVVCKPANGRSSQGLIFVYNEQEWQTFLKEEKSGNYIVEPFIEGPIVMAEVVHQHQGNRTAVMIRRELTSTPNGCSTCVYVFDDPKLADSTRVLAEKLGIEGDVNFEYILDCHGTYHLVECNPRFSAGCEFACLGGYDCVENHLRCFTGHAIDAYEFKHTMIISRKYEEYVTAKDVIVPVESKTYH